MENCFTQEDHNTFQEVVRFLIDKPRWDLTTQEVLQLNKYLGFLNGLNNKIRENILEVTKVVEPEAPATEETE